MRSAILLPPDGRVESGGAIAMLCKPPHGPFIWQQVHVESPTAAARTYHCGLFEKAVVLDNIESPPL